MPTMDILTANSTDWLNFLLAIHALMNGDNPHGVTHFWNPTWALFPLIPFALVPFGRWLLLGVSMIALMVVARRLGARPVAMIAFLLSPLVYDALMWGNIEWLTLLGLAMNPIAGMWLLVLKPQMTIAPIAFMLIFSLRDRGWLASARLIVLPVIGLLVSFIVYGLWIFKLSSYSQIAGQTFSFFPFSVPVGIALFVLSLLRRDIRYAIASSPMFFPAISPQIWLVVPLAFVSSVRWSILTCVAGWVIVILIQYA